MSRPRNSYLPKCTDELKNRKIKVETTDIFSGTIIDTTFETKDAFCSFLQKNEYGIKTFGKLEELQEELKKIKAFITSFKDQVDFLKSNTCFAFSKTKDNEIYTVARGVPGIVYKNASGDLLLQDALSILKIDGAFVAIYKKCYEFLKTIHAQHWYYCDLKCNNIFVMLEKPIPEQRITTNDVFIGDYGSLYNPYADAPLDNCFYTFKTPSSDDFVRFWTRGGRGYRYSVREKIRELSRNDSNVLNIFSKTNLEIVYATWNEVYEEFMYNLNDLSVSKLDSKHIVFARANDWFHFGIAMIELITYIENEDLYGEIMNIYNVFCIEPIMDDGQVKKRQRACVSGKAEPRYGVEKQAAKK
jgi:hypothetical protein